MACSLLNCPIGFGSIPKEVNFERNFDGIIKQHKFFFSVVPFLNSFLVKKKVLWKLFFGFGLGLNEGVLDHSI